LNKLEDVFKLSLLENFQIFSNGNKEDEYSVINLIIVDDEFLIRNSVKRVIFNQLKLIGKNVECKIIEACDGIECILALYVANTKNIRINGIISDETMTFISGSYCSKIIEHIVNDEKFAKVPMFISSALCNINIISKYSSIVQKVYSKPLDKTSALDIFKQIGLI